MLRINRVHLVHEVHQTCLLEPFLNRVKLLLSQSLLEPQLLVLCGAPRPSVTATVLGIVRLLSRFGLLHAKVGIFPHKLLPLTLSKRKMTIIRVHILLGLEGFPNILERNFLRSPVWTW